MRRPRRRQAVVCQQLVELVTDYLEGDLDPDRRAAVEAHLAVCGPCSGYVEQVRRMLALAAAPPASGGIGAERLDALVDRYRRRR